MRAVKAVLNEISKKVFSDPSFFAGDQHATMYQPISSDKEQQK